jgi:hypothetical protein
MGAIGRLSQIFVKIPGRVVDRGTARSSYSVRRPVRGVLREEHIMAEYLILIYGDESVLGNPQSEEANTMMQGHIEFGEKNAAALRGGNALQPTAAATSLRRDGSGGFSVTDGAFAETKEALGGYYLIEAADLDEALSIAKQVPMPAGGVEVRPIRTFD